MGLQVRRGLDDVARADHPADPPAGHRVGLRHAVEHHATVGDVGRHHRNGREDGLAVHEMLVDLVGDHPQAALGRPPPDLGDLLGRVDRPGRVGRGDEDEQLGAAGAGRLQVRR